MSRKSSERAGSAKGVSVEAVGGVASSGRAPPAPEPATSVPTTLAMVVGMSPANVEVLPEPEVNGVAEMVVRYRGPLAAHSRLFVRFGERRAGQDWLDPQDVAMSMLGAEAWAAITCRGGSSLQGVCLAFHASDVGNGGEQWDNAGHTNGYYSFDRKTGRVEAR